NLMFGSLQFFGRPNANNPDGGIGTNFKFTTMAELLTDEIIKEKLNSSLERLNQTLNGVL
ncbi:MAG: hypothetical protein EBY43_06175, partial [Opitutae bacterium]|nr:hypothetical protein [Opitutae bacterium]